MFQIYIYKEFLGFKTTTLTKILSLTGQDCSKTLLYKYRCTMQRTKIMHIYVISKLLKKSY